MNKMTKLGVSALCGSLAAVSAANAGELTVTGGIDMSWLSLENDTTGNPIGMGSNLTFSGSGELDNGWGVALSVAMTNQDAYSNTNVVVTVPSMGDIQEVTITDSVVKNNSEPIVTYSKTKKTSAA